MVGAGHLVQEEGVGEDVADYYLQRVHLVEPYALCICVCVCVCLIMVPAFPGSGRVLD